MKSRLFRSSLVVLAAGAVVFSAGCRTGAGSTAQSGGRRGRVRPSLSLAGQWGFRLDPEDSGLGAGWFNDRLADVIELPGSTVQGGYGEDISVDTKWTGGIVDRSWFTDAKYEKYRQLGSAKVPFWLTPLKSYVGAAWYQKEVDVPGEWKGKRIVLFLERCHWETRVWVDGVEAGMRESLSTPHVYDLSGLMTPGRHVLTIRVDNSIKYNVGVNAHSVSDHTQTNWNGIVGRIELQATDPVWVEDVQVYPDVRAKSAKVRVTIGNATGETVSSTVNVGRQNLINDNDPYRPFFSIRSRHWVTTDVTISEPEQTVELRYGMGDDAPLWDEFSAAMHNLTVSLRSTAKDSSRFRDERTVDFAMRDFAAEGTQFTINGRRTFLRGTLECCIFPLTGYPAMDVAYWTRMLKAAKAHGLNHLRFHSWCPPEAAFAAADRLGVMFHVECPAWTTIGDGRGIDKFIYAEGDRILREYGNHPSFCMLAYGNEPGGRNQKRFLGDLVTYWKGKDGRRVYTSAAGWPIIPENQYHSSPGPRGHQWGAGLRSRFNAKPPETLTDYGDFVEKYDVPVVSHEIGQWCVFPNLKEIEKYTGILRARNFEIVRDSLAENHILDQAEDFLMASGKLQAMLYKQEIESALRTPGFGGFQLLDLHDFPGQGTALVGVLDAFWDSKGYIDAGEHRRYCSETVPLLRMAKRIFTTEEEFVGEVEIAHFGPAPIRRGVIAWSAEYPDGRRFASGRLPSMTIPIGNGTRLGKIEQPLGKAEAPSKLVVTVSVEGTAYSNSWDIWVYPAALEAGTPDGVIIADALDEEVSAALESGGKVLLMPPLAAIDSDIPAGFTSIFWNTAWTRRQPPHTLGILCEPEHPALAEFPTEFHSNWQWWDLVSRSRFMILSDLPAEVRPIVQVIDDWNTNRRLGLLFEAKVGGGRLLFCSMDLRSNVEGRPVARQMLQSLLRYMAGPRFRPGRSVDIGQVRGLLRKPPLLANARVVRVDSEAAGHEGRNAIDGNPGSIWHTAWEGAAPGYPHELVIELAERVAVKGFTYLPRQDMSNGWISQYELYLSDDGIEWGGPVAAGGFPRGRGRQKVLLGQSRDARFIRFVAKAGIDGQIFASVAEIDIIGAEEE
ncbi:MAG: discoidin domain-containing protein [Phycisphaerales bacterium]|nr:MAG: discoidin domain-containing protein [Phycisphaerales bacterium]